jgi:hypothetical protein
LGQLLQAQIPIMKPFTTGTQINSKRVSSEKEGEFVEQKYS